MTGTGVFHWRVRANFPKASGGETPGPYSVSQAFTRTIGEPGNARTDSARDHILLSWDPRLGAKEYKVEISSSPDFSRVVERATTDNPSFAPLMTLSSYAAGGTLYWRVAAADEDRNQGDWTQIQQIRLQPRLRLSVTLPARLCLGNPETERRRRGLSRICWICVQLPWLRSSSAGDAPVERSARCVAREGHQRGVARIVGRARSTTRLKSGLEEISTLYSLAPRRGSQLSRT